MRMRLLQHLLSAGLFGLVLTSSSCQSLQNGEITNASKGENGVIAQVSLPDVVSAGQPVKMTVRITNTGSHKVYYPYVDGIRELRIHLVDSKGAVPELTPEGGKSIGVPEIYYSYDVEALNPGEHYEWHVDLATLFNFRPGTYRLSLNLKFNGDVPGMTLFEISTDPLGFVVQ